MLSLPIIVHVELCSCSLKLGLSGYPRTGLGCAAVVFGRCKLPQRAVLLSERVEGMTATAFVLLRDTFAIERSGQVPNFCLQFFDMVHRLI